MSAPPPPTPTDEQTGVITRNASVVLDFESVAEFQLEVVAADNGDVSRESTVQVLIDILVWNGTAHSHDIIAPPPPHHRI